MPIIDTVPAYLVSRANDTMEATVGPPDFSTSYTSTTLTSIIACAIPMIALMFLAGISWVYHHSLQNPKAINKASGYQLQRFAPLFYIFIVLASLAEVAISSWLLLQWDYHHNYPNPRIRAGARYLLFTACWTTATASIFSFLFVHPRWSRYPISSIGSQALWVLVTWIIWIVGSGIVNAALPSLLVKGSCMNIIYCDQVRSLFGKRPLILQYPIDSVALTLSMAVMIWRAWQSTRDVLHTPNTPVK
ncbi:hypothetical protein P691DRAFT_671571 [Macrolepiota fuliginosa MF-IS2]|uniref:Uncharacterized protein n=1 Tax=Macrolepiota fuliginosa MF-IS2 TaxID=1400762 RepID=A0A9P6C368_9AGAR|nr:hypothetical protein P691DRAFT_671571 [Macrolepiota fuliginosa MF-IS2]